jgi:hypothetical protein
MLFLRNFSWLSTNYTVLYPTKYYPYKVNNFEILCATVYSTSNWEWYKTIPLHIRNSALILQHTAWYKLTSRGGLRNRRSRPWPRGSRPMGPRVRRAGNLSNTKLWRVSKSFRCNKTVFCSLSSLVLIHNKAWNTYPHPTTLFSALEPSTKHWPRAPCTLKPAVYILNFPSEWMKQKRETQQINSSHSLSSCIPPAFCERS